MKKYKIIVCLVLIISLFLNTKVIAEPLEISKDLPLEKQVEMFSLVYGGNVELIKKVIGCESQWNINAHNGNGENSYGLVQINLNAHPEITKEQALNPSFSIEYLVKNIANGNGKMWTSYRAIINGGTYTFYSSKLHKTITVYCK